MEFIWLGQSGLKISFENGRVLMFDPYLSNYVAEHENPALERILPLRKEYLNEKIDALLLSHDHTDHMDPNTLTALFSNPQNREVYIFSAPSVWQKLRGKCPTGANSYCMYPGSEVTPWDGLRIRAVYAAHSDPQAIGFWIEAEGIRVYLSGDTLYHPRVIAELAGQVDLAFVCINGAGNNMNSQDAARLIKQLRVKTAVPVHWDMLPGYTADPELFIQAAWKRGVRTIQMREYEPYDMNVLVNL